MVEATETLKDADCAGYYSTLQHNHITIAACGLHGTEQKQGETIS
jgi:hypothetical protein